jgi:hypothetical protein
MSFTTFQVKIIAASLMVIDHLGFILGNDIFRMLGRFSFPLFAWLLILGEQKTRNWKRYEWRLLAMALISQPLYVAFRGHSDTLNILFLLALALPCLRVTSQNRAGIIQFGVWVTAVMIAEVGSIEYGGYGILFIYLLASFPKILPGWQGLNVLNHAGWIGSYVLLHVLSFFSYPLQPLAGLFVFALPALSQVNRVGRKARWFYWFYPLHFLLLLLFL